MSCAGRCLGGCLDTGDGVFLQSAETCAADHALLRVSTLVHKSELGGGAGPLTCCLLWHVCCSVSTM